MRVKFAWIGWGALIGASVVAVAHAETLEKRPLTVIYDNGPTASTAPYYARLRAAVELAKRNAAKPVQIPKSIAQSILPVRTPTMSPGKVDAYTVNLTQMSRPFFIIGSDSFSQKWLAKHAQKLVQLGAVGMLVQAETEADLRRIADLGPDLRIAPVNGTDVAKNLHLKHYPVLISSQVVEQ
jgi:integrating conjugative element protein (TIGR03765 family)